MTLYLQPLERAISRLREGWTRYQEDTSDEQVREGLIRRFELTYELSHKLLTRYLEMNAPSPEEIDRMTFQDLIRTANEQGLLRGDWPKWRGYREMRAKTSHTCSENVAMEVVAAIPAFLEEAEYLLQQLKTRQG